MRAIRVGELRVPVAATLRREIEEVVDRRQQVDSPFFDIVGHPRVRRVRVSKRAVAVPREDRDGRVLPAFCIRAAQIVFERAVAAAEQPEIAPPSSTSVLRSAGRSAAAAMAKSTFWAR